MKKKKKKKLKHMIVTYAFRMRANKRQNFVTEVEPLHDFADIIWYAIQTRLVLFSQCMDYAMMR